jgi:hypothetical protein
MVDTSPRAVAIDPQWLPHSYDLDGSRLTSVFVPRAKHAELMFLSEEHYPPEILKVTHLASDVAAHLPAAAIAPIHFIFHTAFCGSTLMVKALDIPGRAVGLKEPDVLINLANRLARSDDPANRQRLQLVLRLLTRPSLPGEMTIVKPSNFANRLIRPILEMIPDARAVLLWSDLPTLLRSLVKRGMWGRIWGRKLFRSAGAWTDLNFGYDPGETFELTDLQVAGLAWLMQIHHFGQVASSFGPRVMTVDSSTFLGNPAETLGRGAGLFGLDLTPVEVGEIANGPVFSRHSKFSQRDYSIDEREAEHDAAVAAHGEEIEMVVKWVEAVATHCRVALRPA